MLGESCGGVDGSPVQTEGWVGSAHDGSSYGSRTESHLQDKRLLITRHLPCRDALQSLSKLDHTHGIRGRIFFGLLFKIECAIGSRAGHNIPLANKLVLEHASALHCCVKVGYQAMYELK